MICIVPIQPVSVWIYLYPAQNSVWFFSLQNHTFLQFWKIVYMIFSKVLSLLFFPSVTQINKIKFQFFLFRLLLLFYTFHPINLSLMMFCVIPLDLIPNSPILPSAVSSCYLSHTLGFSHQWLYFLFLEFYLIISQIYLFFSFLNVLFLLYVIFIYLYLETF